MTGVWQVTIPAPAAWISANQRTDRRRQTPVRQAWRDATLIHARAAKLPQLQRAHVLAVLRFADRRRRDAHNYYPVIKVVVDALVAYGLLPDDSTQYLDGPDLRIGDPVPASAWGPVGELELTISALPPRGGA